mmetsp:Transcript_27792/g.75609  ORF Transcript_27792/g.75609 Transcript_27792/m.75609 type:complete len:1016 (-) Transcript_27792:208-3255(-)
MAAAARTTPKSSSQASSPSLWTAMIRSPMLPHGVFLAMACLVKALLPALLKWLAYDSISPILLTVWYPLCATISLIHRDLQHRHQEMQNDENKSISSSDPRGSIAIQTERQYWIQYWSVGFAGVQCLHQIIELFPSLQRKGLQEYPNIPVILAEAKLLFFVWIFCMEPLLSKYQRFLGEQQQKDKWKKHVPLTVLTKAAGPKLMGLQMTISECISKDTWQRLIQSKVQRVLEVLVLLQFLKESSRDYLLRLLEEGRSLLLLSVFAVLPSSISQVGILYVQYIFPGARSLVTRGDALEVLTLKYWVLNNLLSLFLSFTWWLWWCVPFSTQVLLGIWCFATFPSTITHYYSMIEMELITFGILSGKPKLSVKKTMTVQALRHFVKRLPRDKQAQSFQFEIDDDSVDEKRNGGGDDSSIDSEDTTESERERRRQRRRERRARKKLKAGAKSENGVTRPPPLLSESLISRYANEEKEEAEKYEPFVNENHTRKNDERNQNNHRSTETEERDTADVAPVESAAHKVEARPPTPPTATTDTHDNDSKKAKRILPKKLKAESAPKDDSERTILPSISTTVASSNSDPSTVDLQPFVRGNKINEEMEEVTLDSLSDDTNTLIPAPTRSIENEIVDRDLASFHMLDTKDDEDDESDRALLPSMTIGSNYSSSQVHSDAKLMNLNIATPTENVTGEVEVQVKPMPGPSNTTVPSKTSTRSIFPATHPNSSSRNSLLLMPSASIKKSLSLVNSLSNPEANIIPEMQSKPLTSDVDSHIGTESGLYLSDIDTAASSMIDDVGSFEISTPLNGNMNKSPEAKREEDVVHTKSTTTTLENESTAPRRSSRLKQLREWQEQKEKSSSSKTTKASEPTSRTRTSSKSSATTAEKNAKRSTTATKKAASERSLEKVRRKVSPATSSLEKESVANKPTAASLSWRVEKKSTISPRNRIRTPSTSKSTSTAVSPDKPRRSRKGKAEAPIPKVERSTSIDSSPRKAAGSKGLKIPNSRRKKKESSSVFGSMLGRK